MRGRGLFVRVRLIPLHNQLCVRSSVLPWLSGRKANLEGESGKGRHRALAGPSPEEKGRVTLSSRAMGNAVERL